MGHMMCIIVLFGMVHPMYVTCLGASCAKIEDIQLLTPNLKCKHVFKTLTTDGVMNCARECLSRTRCKSFDFDLASFKCRLCNTTDTVRSTTGDGANSGSDGGVGDNTSTINIVASEIILWPKRLASLCEKHTCPDNTVCQVATNGTRICEVECVDPPALEFGVIPARTIQHKVGTLLDYVCFDGMYRRGEARCGSDGQWSRFRCARMCLDTPVIENGELNHIQQNDWVEGFELGFTCNDGYAPLGKLTCGESGTWSPAACTERVTSCSALEKCIPDFPDDEYWLFPFLNSPDVAVKIFCSWQNNDSVVDFITLPNENFAFFDPYRCQQINQNYVCTSVLVSRVRIRLSGDSIQMNFGWPHLTNSSLEECSKFPAFHNCPSYGPCSDDTGTPFRVDFGQTGLIVDSSTQWRTTENKEVTYEWLNENTVISGICKADCANCLPEQGKLNLVIDPNYTPGFYTATAPVCVP